MARQERELPARKSGDRSRDDDSMLLRSAESLGRVIGALQRQLDGATKRLMHPDGDGTAAARVKRRLVRKSTAKKRTSAARKTSAKKR